MKDNQQEEIKSIGNSSIESKCLAPLIKKALPLSTSTTKITPFDDSSTKEETNTTSFSGATVTVMGNDTISGKIGEGYKIKTMLFPDHANVGTNTTMLGANTDPFEIHFKNDNILNSFQGNKMVSIPSTSQIKPSNDSDYNKGIGSISFSNKDTKPTIAENVTISSITSTNSDHSAYIHIKEGKILTLKGGLGSDLEHLIFSNDQGKELDLPASEFKLPCTINDQLEIQPLGLLGDSDQG